MRVIAGQWRGRPLAAPKGEATRPTADRTREALFSMLTSRVGGFEGLAVADIFAGSGALGIEALSRGAAHATFVDQDAQAIAAIKANLARLGTRGEVMAAAVAALGPARRAHDLLLFDPPYGTGGAGALIERLTRLGWATATAWASIETGRKEEVSAAGWSTAAVRDHGKARLTLLMREGTGGVMD